MANLARSFEGMGRLQVDSTSQISLQRYKGSWIPLKIGGLWVAAQIPSSGPTLSNSGLVQATLYYIYAFDSGGTLTLEASTTVSATDADHGIRIKNGDATRTLVGMVYMDTGSPGLYRDSVTKRWCLNYFHRRNLDLLNAFTTTRQTTSTTYAEVNTEIRIQFLSWADDAVVLSISGDAHNESAGQAVFTAIGIDGTTPVAQVSTTQPGAGGIRGPACCTSFNTVSEGFHYATLLGAVSGGTGDWQSATNTANGDTKAELHGMIRG